MEGPAKKRMVFPLDSLPETLPWARCSKVIFAYARTNIQDATAANSVISMKIFSVRKRGYCYLYVHVLFQTAVDPCRNENPCKNGGTCISKGKAIKKRDNNFFNIEDIVDESKIFNAYICLCTKCWIAKNCDEPVLECRKPNYNEHGRVTWNAFKLRKVYLHSHINFVLAHELSLSLSISLKWERF